MIGKTFGEIIINDLNIENKLDLIRDQIGYCCQKDILYNELSVIEHIKYFAKIKGIDCNLMN